MANLKLINEQGGTLLLITVLISVAILLVSITASDMVKNGLVMNKERHNSTIAYFAAEAGAEKVLEAIRNNSFVPQSEGCINIDQYFCFSDIDGSVVDIDLVCGAGFSNTQTLPSGAIYSVQCNYEDDGLNSTTTIRSLGVYQQGTEREVGRRVELMYTN